MSTRLLDEMRDLMRRRHYSIHTERAYGDWIKRYVRFHNMQSRDDLRQAEEKIEAFLTHLARDRQVAASTQNQAMNALVFLYKHVLEQPLSGEINADRARKQPRIPVVLTREETARVIAWMSGVHQLIVKLLYGSGPAHHGVPPAPGPGRGPGDEGPHGCVAARETKTVSRRSPKCSYSP